MTYIPRTITIGSGDSERTASEDEISGLGRLVVLLAEPGAGKTELASALADRFDALRVSAMRFARGSVHPSDLAGKSLLVVDGLDELAGRRAGDGVDRVVAELERLGAPNALITCRAAEWEAARNRALLREIYGAEPVETRLEPFSYNEQMAFVESIAAMRDAHQFLHEAERRDLGAMLGNPQNLLLLLDAVTSDDAWPATRTELFEKAAHTAVWEANERLITSDRAPEAQILRAAGEIFATILLAGAEGVDRLESTDPSYPFLNRVMVAPDGALRTAVDSRLFRAAGASRLMPAHRTIAEYLGGLWLADRIDAGLSTKRLTAVIAPDNNVRSDLRTLHAWIACFGPSEVRRAAIERDPYGVIRYGDPTRFTGDEKRRLLAALRKLAEDDPYFRSSEGWTRPMIAGFFDASMRQDVLAILHDPARKHHLSTLLLEAMTGTQFAEDLLPDLLGIVDDENRGCAERSDAASALAHLTVFDWQSLVARLCERNTENSARLSLEIIADRRGSDFSAALIGDAIADSALRGSEDDDADLRTHYFHIVDRLDALYLDDVLDRLAIRMAPMCGGLWRFNCKCSRALTPSVRALLNRRWSEPTLVPPSPDRVWQWLRKLSAGSQGREDSLSAALIHDDDLRRAVQALALRDREYEENPWMRFCNVPETQVGLEFTIDDIRHHLTKAAEQDEADVWSDLVTAARRDRNLRRLARRQALGSPALMVAWARSRQARRQASSASVLRWRKGERRRSKRRLENLEERRADFLRNREQIENGTHDGWLIHIGHAFLGRFAEASGRTPRERLSSFLGDDLVEPALAGLRSFLRRGDLPTLDRIVELGVMSKSTPMEAPLCAGVLAHAAAGGSVDGLSFPILEAARGAHSNGLYFEKSDGVLYALEAALFRSRERAESFLRRILEPRLQANSGYINDLYLLASDDRLAAFAGELAFEWLRRFPSIGPQVARQLLKSAIAHGDREAVRAFVLGRCTTRCTTIEAEWAIGPPTEALFQARRLWLSAAFLLSPNADGPGARFAQEHRNHLFAIREIILPDRISGSDSNIIPWPSPTLAQSRFLLENYGPDWANTLAAVDRRRPGRHDPWEAQHFLRQLLEGIAASDDPSAGDALDALIHNDDLAVWRDWMQHLSVGWRRRRRDATLPAPGFSAVQSLLSNDGPATVEDLQAMMIEALERLQDAITNGDTAGWPPYWSGDRPYGENTCRDQVMTRLRPYFQLRNVQLRPECKMPEDGRVDIVASMMRDGETSDLPIEVKGQWHDEVWTAAVEQLDSRYARYENARARGVYLVLWFGIVPQKNLPPRPDGRTRPTDLDGLRAMLTEDLPVEVKERISVVVLDVSRA